MEVSSQLHAPTALTAENNSDTQQIGGLEKRKMSCFLW